MTDWFARPCLTWVTDVEASPSAFMLTGFGFTIPWRYDEDGKVIRRTGRSAGLRAYPGQNVAGKNWQGADIHFP